MKPIIKYRGGKSKEIKNFLQFIPHDYDRYVEPFAGGAALYFYLEPQLALINDINPKLIDFYLAVQNNYEQLKKELVCLESIYQSNQIEYEILKKSEDIQGFVENKNEALYYLLRDMYNGKIEKKYLDATLYYFINKTSYSGMLRFNSKGEFNVPFGRYKNFNTEIVSEEHRALLRRTEITQMDYSKVFERSSTKDFVFLDPPYDCVFTDYGNVGENDFLEQSQIKLAEDFRNLSAKSLMIIGKTELTKKLYGPYIKAEYSKKYAVNIRNRFKAESKHLIITNYNI
ncbi:Dam family site-specific DNA-(adenine-N6)-methyltransferase [Segatella oulorum]|uniref:DNA adenine methylase n=1 Tax=Segatella oulorum TaxID=28136 RepID=UPI0028E31FC5|nr:Dam family site-specific DNA-(adenine-N6)-methyltransferase [Segatella oulorum]